MIIGYARVSTEEQDTKMQLYDLKKAGCEKIYQEKVSTRQAKRPILEDLLRSMRKGDTFVVWRLDRLGRSLKELIHLAAQLAEKEIELKSLHEEINISTPAGNFIFHALCAVAEYEREIIRQRTLEGLKAAKRENKVLGRPRGLSIGAQQKAHIVATIYREGKLSVHQICHQLTISVPTLYRYLEAKKVPLRTYKPPSDTHAA